MTRALSGYAVFDLDGNAINEMPTMGGNTIYRVTQDYLSTS